MPSFDIVSEVENTEVKNAVEQTNKEVSTRFDFKGSDARVEQAELVLTVHADNEFQLNQVQDILNAKLTKRGVDIKCLDISDKIDKVSGNKVGVVTLAKADQIKLASEGGLLFTSGDAQLNPVRDVKLSTGNLESSNTDLSSEMVLMIQNQRMYDLLTRSLQMQDDGLGHAIQDLSGV